MRLPYLKSWDKTPIIVDVTETGIDENGAPIVAGGFVGTCNFMRTTKTVRSSDGQYVTLGGVLTIKGDIFPALPVITGTAKINGGAPQNIYSSQKVLNPDGSVNHTQLELI